MRVTTIFILPLATLATARNIHSGLLARQEECTYVCRCLNTDEVDLGQTAQCCVEIGAFFGYLESESGEV
jgi:hypothetical protein